VARKRPTVSDAVQPGLTSPRDDRSNPDGSLVSRHEAVATEELLSIVIRAGQLGYSPWRVGIALRVAPTELAWICAHLNESHAPSAKTLTAALAARAADLPPAIAASSTAAARGMMHEQPL